MVWAVILWGLPFTQQLLNQSTDPILLVIAVMVGLISTGIVLYLTTRLDWGIIVGKRFPWTLL